MCRFREIILHCPSLPTSYLSHEHFFASHYETQQCLLQGELEIHKSVLQGQTEKGLQIG